MGSKYVKRIEPFIVDYDEISAYVVNKMKTLQDSGKDPKDALIEALFIKMREKIELIGRRIIELEDRVIALENNK